MKYVKTFENFSINEEENIFKAAAGFFGKYNSDTREKAEKEIAEFGKKFRTSKHVDIFNQLKEAYDSKKETTLAAQKSTTFSYEETKLTVEDVKKLFEEICCIIRMNDANAFGIKSNKEGKLETYQSKSYSGPDSPMGTLLGGK
jgi:hypothetical protein